MTSAPQHLVVAGTAGGVGATTVTALLFGGLKSEAGGAPALLDHTGGDLAARLPEGEGVAQVNDALRLHDLGRHALSAGVALLAEPGTRLVLVSAATPAGCALAERALAAVVAEDGASGTSRTVVVLVEVFGRHRIRGQLKRLSQAQLPAVVVLGQDLTLAAGGRIVSSRLTRRTRRFGYQLLAALATPPAELTSRYAGAAVQPGTPAAATTTRPLPVRGARPRGDGHVDTG